MAFVTKTVDSGTESSKTMTGCWILAMAFLLPGLNDPGVSVAHFPKFLPYSEMGRLFQKLSESGVALSVEIRDGPFSVLSILYFYVHVPAKVSTCFFHDSTEVHKKEAIKSMLQ